MNKKLIPSPREALLLLTLALLSAILFPLLPNSDHAFLLLIFPLILISLTLGARKNAPRQTPIQIPIESKNPPKM